MRSERRFDFAELDAEAAQLGLVIASAKELQRAIAVPARQVAGAIQACPRFGKGIGLEAGGGECGLAEVAAGDAAAADA